jgi:hypothetical protein
MNITFIPGSIPELIIEGSQLFALGFDIGTPVKLTVHRQTLWVTIVKDDASWKALCAASQYRDDIGADWVRDNGELIIGGDWLTDFGISRIEQLELTAMPGTIRLQRREVDVFRA